MASRRGSGWLVAAIVAGAWAWTASDPKQPDAPRKQSTTTSLEKTSTPPAEKSLVVEAPPAPKVALGEPDNRGRPMSTATLAPAVEQVLYTTAKVRMRAQPTTSAPVVQTVAAGELVRSSGRQGEWHNVTVGPTVGWIRGDFLTSSAPAALRPKVDIPPPAPLVTIEPRPSRNAKVSKQEQRSDGDPIREAYVGKCDCPYDVKRNGASCGGTSAWSRPGGRSPVCFVGE